MNTQQSCKLLITFVVLYFRIPCNGCHALSNFPGQPLFMVTTVSLRIKANLHKSVVT
ncbi:hypothetical protein AHF37_12767 [Paragonimus kellicotti]|nr:hypothetical protein AHF37_12767 [Paragonimus kellicotti]